MYKTYSFITGAIIAVMLLSNSLMMKAVGNVSAILAIHIIGFIGAIVLTLVTKTKPKSLKNIPIIYLLGGFTGYFTVFIANIAFSTLGATITLMLSMFGQIVTSTVIDHYGLLGMERFPFRKSKLIGMALMICGVALIVFL